MYFVRLQGCDVGCYFCDTKYTWRDSSPTVNEIDIANRAKASGAEWVCITGGEPYEQQLQTLVYSCLSQGLRTHVETSGGAPWQDTGINWICLSPKDLFTKKEFKTKIEFKQYSHEIKCVVTKESDVDYYLENYYDFCRWDKPLIFQLVDNDTKLAQIVFDKTNHIPHTRIMLQVHKLLEMR